MGQRQSSSPSSSSTAAPREETMASTATTTTLSPAVSERKQETTMRTDTEGPSPSGDNSDKATASAVFDFSTTRTNLVRRCKREYGWDDDYAQRAVQAYSHFMALKRHLQDWDDTKVSPPPAIYRVWQQHVLDTKDYVSWCQPNLIHFNPDPVCPERVRTTMESMAQHFPDVDTTEDVWAIAGGATNRKRSANDNDSDGDDDEEESSTRKRRRTQETPDASSTSSSSSIGEDSAAAAQAQPAAAQQPQVVPASRQPLTFFVRWSQNPDPTRSSDLYFKIRPDTKMQRVFDRYNIYWNDAMANLGDLGNNPEYQQDFVFFFGSRMVSGTDTASSLGLTSDDMLYATRSSAVEIEDA